MFNEQQQRQHLINSMKMMLFVRETRKQRNYYIYGIIAQQSYSMMLKVIIKFTCIEKKKNNIVEQKKSWKAQKMLNEELSSNDHHLIFTHLTYKSGMMMRSNRNIIKWMIFFHRISSRAVSDKEKKFLIFL